MDNIIYIESGISITPYMNEVREIYKNTPKMFFTNDDVIKYCQPGVSGDKFISLRLPEQTVPELSTSASTKLVASVSGFSWGDWSQKIYSF